MRRWIIAVGLLAAGCTPAEHREAEAAVKAQLSDPGSAQFRNLRTKWNRGTKIVCGDVNAKNRLGGYEGFRPFIHTVGGRNTFIANEFGPSSFDGC